MTTTPQVDLAEARKLADRLKPDLPTVLRIDAEHAGDTIRSLADEVEALRKEIEGWKADQRENIQVAIALQSELAALNAVGPDGLPPLPEPAHSREAPDFTADQMQAYARAAIALAHKGKQ